MDVHDDDPVLGPIALELSLYHLHRIDVSGSLRHVLCGEDEEFCNGYFDKHRRGRFAEIHALVVAMLPVRAYGSTENYRAWLNNE